MTYTNSATNVPGAFSYYYYYNLWLVSTPTRTLSTLNVGPIAANDVFEFYYGARNVSEGNVLLEVFVSTDFGNTYNLLTDFTYDGINGWKKFSHPLAAYVGQNVKMKLVATRIAGDNYLGFDNFYIGPCGIAPIPSVSSATTNSVTLNWDGSPTETNVVEWGPVGFTQGSGTFVTVTGTTVVISGLTENTNYEYYIRRTCTADNSVIWLGKYKFKTACNTFVGPFSENFSSVATGSSTNQTLPDCWSFYDGGSGYGYVGTTALATPKSFQMYTADLVNPYILISPETQNLGDGNYRVKFNARSETAGQTLIFGTMFVTLPI